MTDHQHTATTPVPYLAFATADGNTVATASGEQMRALDRAAEAAGLAFEQMAEHAGHRLAELAYFLGAWGRIPPRIVVLAGPGHNGAAGLVTARHLANRGARVAALLSGDEHAMGDATRRQAGLLRAGDIEIVPAATSIPGGADIIIDALVGYSLRGPLRGPERVLAEAAMAEAESLVLSMDVPSGFDADHGPLDGTAVRPAATMTVALPKHGLLSPEAGDVWLADIGIPRALYVKTQLTPPPLRVARERMIPLSRRAPGSGRPGDANP